MTKLLFVLLAVVFFTSCAGTKNATQRIDNAYSVTPLQDHYSKNSYDYAESWRKLREAKLTPY